MKQHLIQLNHPLLINNSRTEEPNYETVYGFFAPYYDDDDDDEGHNEWVEDNILSYLGYLAAIHEWTNNNAETFTIKNIDGIYQFIDLTTGDEHNCKDQWCYNLGEECKRKLNLDFKLYVVDIDPDEDCYHCCSSGSTINCQFYMDSLVRTAEEQMEDDRDMVAVLFNRPIWLPTDLMWDGDLEHTLVYGAVRTEKGEECSDLQKGDSGYLGYLAMIEDCYLSGTTPSGYKIFINNADNGLYWTLDGRTGYSCMSDAVLKEGDICREKHNLKIKAEIPGLKYKDIKYGVRCTLILSQELYEELLTIDRYENGNLDVRIRDVETE